MASQLSILQNNERADYQRYRFYLQTQKGQIELSIQPDGWSEGEIEYKRSEIYHGVSRTVSVKELMFVKEAREFLKYEYDNRGPTSKITLKVDYLKSDYTYDTYYTGLVDLYTYVEDEDGVRVSVIDNSFKSKVYTRDDVELALGNTTAIDGETVTDWSDQTVLMPDTSIDRQSDYVENDTTTFLTVSPHLVPMDVQAGSDFTETQNQVLANSVSAANGFFPSSLADRIIRVHGTAVIDVIGDTDPHDWEVTMKVYLYDTDGTYITSYNLDDESQTGAVSPTFNLSYDRYVTVLEGQSLAVVATVSPVGADYKITYNDVTLAADETFDGTPAHTTLGWQYYEAFLRLTQLMTGQLNPFYSDFFGRTDSAITTYASDGEIGFVVRGIYFRITSGAASNGDYPLALTFRDLFTSLSSIYYLGMAVETISGVEKVRVEDMDYFFDENVVVDISDRIRTENIEKMCKADDYYKSVTVGYNKSEYDAVEGLFEYNTKSTWTTHLVNDAKLDLVSKYRADNQGIRLILKAPEASDYDNSKDYKGDEDIFFVDAFNDSGTYTASTDEDFTTVGGTIYADLSFNLLLTPARSLRRNGSLLNGGLAYIPSTSVRWQSSDKNTQLYTQLTTETAPVYENGDIVASELNDCRWLNNIYKVEAYLTPAEKLLIDANLHGLVKLDTDKYGWIMNLKTKNEDGKAVFELLECNTTVVTPVE